MGVFLSGPLCVTVKYPLNALVQINVIEWRDADYQFIPKKYYIFFKHLHQYTECPPIHCLGVALLHYDLGCYNCYKFCKSYPCNRKSPWSFLICLPLQDTMRDRSQLAWCSRHFQQEYWLALSLRKWDSPHAVGLMQELFKEWWKRPLSHQWIYASFLAVKRGHSQERVALKSKSLPGYWRQR